MKIQRYNESIEFGNLELSRSHKMIDNLIDNYLMSKSDIEDVFTTENTYDKIFVTYCISKGGFIHASIKTGDVYSEPRWNLRWLNDRKDNLNRFYSEVVIYFNKKTNFSKSNLEVFFNRLFSNERVVNIKIDKIKAEISSDGDYIEDIYSTMSGTEGFNEIHYISFRIDYNPTKIDFDKII